MFRVKLHKGEDLQALLPMISMIRAWAEQWVGPKGSWPEAAVNPCPTFQSGPNLIWWISFATNKRFKSIPAHFSIWTGQDHSRTSTQISDRPAEGSITSFLGGRLGPFSFRGKLVLRWNKKEACFHLFPHQNKIPVKRATGFTGYKIIWIIIKDGTSKNPVQQHVQLRVLCFHRWWRSARLTDVQVHYHSRGTLELDLPH